MNNEKHLKQIVASKPCFLLDLSTQNTLHNNGSIICTGSDSQNFISQFICIILCCMISNEFNFILNITSTNIFAIVDCNVGSLTWAVLHDMSHSLATVTHNGCCTSHGRGRRSGICWCLQNRRLAHLWNTW